MQLFNQQDPDPLDKRFCHKTEFWKLYFVSYDLMNFPHSLVVCV